MLVKASPFLAPWEKAAREGRGRVGRGDSRARGYASICGWDCHYFWQKGIRLCFS